MSSTVLPPIATLIEEAALGRLVLRYAQAVDRRDGAALGALFLPDGALLDGQRFDYRGREAISAVPGRMRHFDRTWHIVHNMLFDIDGDAAEGEIHSTAHHLTGEASGAAEDLVMRITYRDRYRRHEGAWHFARRLVVVQWTETRRVDPAAA